MRISGRSILLAIARAHLFAVKMVESELFQSDLTNDFSAGKYFGCLLQVQASTTTSKRLDISQERMLIYLPDPPQPHNEFTG